ncbi:hypothetical protein GL263_25515 [Streptomyces durbertensis]|uniref:CdiI immunity protein domain-containing protein n=1 Tax=Streptomyces durbertensis TaxID=2448886 RepID=A0ABR6EP33_9ACTN|nr:hypothetical protein [Streptomyces durbertensis]MBB1246883.1 hypothetical protein [Streptomyces durbertensis]
MPVYRDEVGRVLPESLGRFAATYLYLEIAHDPGFGLRETLHAFGQRYADAVRVELAELVGERYLSVADYECLTSVEFETEDDLYTYLADMVEHLFGDGRGKPVPPS